MLIPPTAHKAGDTPHSSKALESFLFLTNNLAFFQSFDRYPLPPYCVPGNVLPTPETAGKRQAGALLSCDSQSGQMTSDGGKGYGEKKTVVGRNVVLCGATEVWEDREGLWHN